MNTPEAISLEKYESEVKALRNKIAYLEEQVEWFTRQIFGQRSEKHVPTSNDVQLTFDGLEDLETTDIEQKKEVAGHTRSKPKRDGEDKITFSENIPVETVILDVPEEEKTCQETGKSLVKIGEEVSHKLAHKPGSYYVKRIVRPKYAYPAKAEGGILTAELPDSLLPKCRADESLLAEIITKKFADHLPLYRIQEILAREGIRISRKLLSQWVVRAGKVLKPLRDEMIKQILESGNVFIDEAPVKLQEKVKCKQAYMWVVAGGKSADPPYRVYEFKQSRSHDHVLDILRGYQGGLHSDKYGAYQRLAERKVITWYPCFAHIRRKFFEAESGDPELRKWVLRKLKYLFMYERIAWKRSEEERLKIRQEREIPILDELIERIKERLVDGKILPKSKLREALHYFYGLVPYLKNYTKDPFARLDNNVAERAIRPLAIGRKNWIFFGSPDGGEAGAVLLSLVQTCRGLKINPREYLEDIMRRFMGHSSNRLQELLPDEWQKSRQEDLEQQAKTHN